jgi:hypothetical protein
MRLQPVIGHHRELKRFVSVILVTLAGLLLSHSSAALTEPAATPQEQQPPSDNAIMRVTLWAGKNGRGRYEVALLRTILDRTADNYPAYQLSVNSSPFGTQRGRQVVADGEQANVYVSGLREDDYTRNRDILMIRRPVMKGLFGYRAAIIRQGDGARYAQSAQQHNLRDLTIGQGSHWEDAMILRYNNFTVNDNGRFENLFEMLAYGRFDAIFLGIAEIEPELAAAPLNDKLTIAYQPIIYYPHAMVFQVSGKHPQLSRRIKEGFAQISDDGTHDQLLEHYFGGAINRIRAANTNIFVLKHPTPSLMPELTQPMLIQPPELNADL